MRTLIGIAVVFGIFLTASVATAKVYRCTALTGYMCNRDACNPIGGLDGLYFLLNQKTGEVKRCGPKECFDKYTSMTTVRNEINADDIQWFETTPTGEISGSMHEMSKSDGSWYFKTTRYAFKNNSFIRTHIQLLFGFCH